VDVSAILVNPDEAARSQGPDFVCGRQRVSLGLHRPPPLQPPIRANPTPETNPKLDKTWWQSTYSFFQTERHEALRMLKIAAVYRRDKAFFHIR
jgi:hypothetical protein